MPDVGFSSDLKTDLLHGLKPLADASADGDGGLMQIRFGVAASFHEFLKQPAVLPHEREQPTDETFAEILDR